MEASHGPLRKPHSHVDSHVGIPGQAQRTLTVTIIPSSTTGCTPGSGWPLDSAFEMAQLTSSETESNPHEALFELQVCKQNKY